MAGKPGRSGGARPGAGRKPQPPPQLGVAGVLADAMAKTDPQAFLLAVMNDMGSDARLRIDAAKALMPFMHQKLGEGGKKDAKNDAAKKAGAGKFAAAAPPLKLVAR